MFTAPGDEQVSQEGADKATEQRRTEVELAEDALDGLVRLGRVFLVQLRPLCAKLVRLILPRLECRRVDDGWLNDLGAGKDAPGDGVRAGRRVRAEVALLVDGVVRDRGSVAEDLEKRLDEVGWAEEFEVGLGERGRLAGCSSGFSRDLCTFW